MTALLCRQTRIKTLRLSDCEAHHLVNGDTVLTYDLANSRPSFRRVVLCLPTQVRVITIEVMGGASVILPREGQVLDADGALVSVGDYPDMVRGFCPIVTNRPSLKKTAAFYEGGDEEGLLIEWPTDDYLWTGGLLSGRD